MSLKGTFTKLLEKLQLDTQPFTITNRNGLENFNEYDLACAIFI